MTSTRVLALALGLLAAGCGPKLERVELTAITSPPLGVDVSGSGVQIPEGIAVAVRVTGWDAEGEPVDNLTIEPKASGVADALEFSSSRYILYGISPGSGKLTISADLTPGALGVPVTVTEQN